MSEPTPQSTIVPPYMGEHWRRLRANLIASCEIAGQTTAFSTPEQIRPLVSAAMYELMGADMQLTLIERDGDVAILDADD